MKGLRADRKRFFLDADIRCEDARNGVVLELRSEPMGFDEGIAGASVHTAAIAS
jgi:hypothetical protein